MLCYILAYYLTKKYKDNKYIFIIPIIIGIFVLTKGINFFIFNRNVARGLLSFFIGVLLGNKDLLNIFDNMSKKKNIIIKSLMFLVISLFIIVIIFDQSELYIGNFIDNVLTYSLLFFPLIILFLYNIKWINWIGNTKLFKFLGNISFGIYVWNFPILIILTYLLKVGLLHYTNAYKFMILSFIIHIIVASLSYILIEKLLTNKIKKKLKK